MRYRHRGWGDWEWSRNGLSWHPLEGKPHASKRLEDEATRVEAEIAFDLDMKLNLACLQPLQPNTNKGT